jgi:hypothetical protein
MERERGKGGGGGEDGGHQASAFNLNGFFLRRCVSLKQRNMTPYILTFSRDRRAKRHLVVVGNPDALSKGSADWAAILAACKVPPLSSELATF